MKKTSDDTLWDDMVRGEEICVNAKFKPSVPLTTTEQKAAYLKFLQPFRDSAPEEIPDEVLDRIKQELSKQADASAEMAAKVRDILSKLGYSRYYSQTFEICQKLSLSSAKS